MRLSRLPRGNPAGWALAAAASLLAGYVDLWRGGTSLAAVLLVLGYLVLVPLTVRAWRYAVPDEVERPQATLALAETPPYRWAIALSVVVLLLYIVTLSPTTAMWDTSEYIAVAKVLGLPHPPGNPLFVLVAHAFGLLPIPVSYAERVNLLAATTSAISAGLWFLVAHRALRGTPLPPVSRLVAAALSAWIGATAFTVWNQSVVNEKVYTLAMLGVAIASWLALRWNDAPAESRRSDLALLLIAYTCGLGYAIHPAGFLPLPAFGLYVLLRRPLTVLRWKLVGSAAALLFLGLTPFLFEPIRASHNPPINEGDPTACVGGPRMDCILSELTWQRLRSNIQREQYGGHAVAVRQAPLSAQVGMWWLYFKWQWTRDLLGQHPLLQRALAIVFLLLAGLGGASHWRRDRDSFLFVGPLLLTLTPALIFYLNFKYGWSQSPELGDSVPREVRDRDYFFVWSFASLAIWIGMGLAALWSGAAALIARSAPTVGRRALVYASPVLLLAVVPFAANLSSASRADHEFTATWARDLLQSVEPYGIIITNGDNDSFPLWYAQQVEGVRRDVSVVLLPYLGIDWYVRQLLRAQVDQYDGSGLPEYARLAGARPTTPPLRMTPAEADAIPPYVELPQPQEFRHGDIRATIQPGIFTRDQFVVLRLITDAFPQRPIYFSVGRFPHSLGLGEYVVGHGLAQKLLPVPASSLPGIVKHQGGYLDVARTKALWERYEGLGELLDSPEWVDNASLVMPSIYVSTGQLLAQSLAAGGNGAAADSVMDRTVRVARKLHMVR